MIDILLATYNGEKYIRQQLDSILTQSCSDFKLFICDDASDDTTYEILKEYSQRHPDTIDISRNEYSLGARQNFFNLLKNSTAEYVMFADQDDVWLYRKIEYSLKAIKSMEAVYGEDLPLLIHSDLKVVDDSLKIISESMSDFLKQDSHRKNLGFLLVENVVTGNTIILNQALRREFIGSDKAYMHDWWLALIACIRGRIAYIDKPLCLYRQHSGNILGAKPSHGLRAMIIERYKNRLKVKENYRKMYEQAEALLELYEARLSPGQEELLRNFVAMRRLGRLKKIVTILKYKFLKSSPLMSFGMLWNI